MGLLFVSWVYYYISRLSHACIHDVAQASLGIRQSPLGERLTDPTLGPSGKQDRLNCWAKNRRKNVVSHFFMALRSYCVPKGFLCQEVDFLGLAAMTQKVVKEEVMQFIRPYKIFGFLFDVTLFVSRNQFRTDGSIDDVEQCARFFHHSLVKPPN